MKLILVSTDREATPPERGGAIGRWVFDFGLELARRGHEVIIIGRPNNNVDYRRHSIEFVSLSEMPNRVYVTLDKVFHGNLRIIPNSVRLASLSSLLNNADIIQAHYFTTSAILPLLARRPILVQVWHNIPKANLANKVLVQKFNLVAGVSKLIAKKLMEYLRVKPQHVAVLYDFVDTNKFRPDPNLREIYRDRFRLSDSDEAILYVGRIIPEKGLHYLILALAYLAKKFNNLKLLVVGPSGHFDIPNTHYVYYVRELAYRLGLQNRIIWLGNVASKDLPGIYNAADIVVIPTVMEEGGVLLVTLESMASGKPVVAYNSGAISEAIEHMKTGILVPPRDVRELANAIKMLLEDNRLRKLIALNARMESERKIRH